MKNDGRKILSLTLIAIMLLSLFNFTSCNRSYDEDEVIAATKILLKDAEMLNKVYYGSGIEYFDSDEEKGYYRKANVNHLEKLGFFTIEELMTLTEKTFSDEYSELLYTTILSALNDNTAIVSPARYYQAYDEKTGLPTHIMVYSAFEPMFKDSVVYDYDSIRVERSKKERVHVKVDVAVTNGEGKSQHVTITVMLVEEDDGWKIDNPTYANYNELKDRYDELNNKI